MGPGPGPSAQASDRRRATAVVFTKYGAASVRERFAACRGGADLRCRHGDGGRTWHVLLVGGASGVGKTTLASALGRYYGVDVTQLDDIQTALETMTTPEQQPLIHFWQTNWAEFNAFTDDDHVNHFLDVSRQVYSRVLAAVVADRLDGGTPVIIEGDFILPELATRADFDGQPNDGRVRALFVEEGDEAQIAANVGQPRSRRRRRLRRLAAGTDQPAQGALAAAGVRSTRHPDRCRTSLGVDDRAGRRSDLGLTSGRTWVRQPGTAARACPR